MRKRSLNGARFALARRDEEVADFLDQTWIDGWLRRSFLQYASQVENRSEQAIQQALRVALVSGALVEFALTLLGEQLTVPEVKFVTHTLSTPAIGRSDSGCRQYAYLRRLDRRIMACE